MPLRLVPSAPVMLTQYDQQSHHCSFHPFQWFHQDHQRRPVPPVPQIAWPKAWSGIASAISVRIIGAVKRTMKSCSFPLERWSSIIKRIDLMNGSKKQEDAIRLRITLTSFIDVVEWIIKYELRSRRDLRTEIPCRLNLRFKQMR